VLRSKWRELRSFLYFPNEFANLDHFVSPLSFHVRIFVPQSLFPPVLPRRLSAFFPGFSSRFSHGSPLSVDSGSISSVGFRSRHSLPYKPKYLKFFSTLRKDLKKIAATLLPNHQNPKSTSLIGFKSVKRAGASWRAVKVLRDSFGPGDAAEAMWEKSPLGGVVGALRGKGEKRIDGAPPLETGVCLETNNRTGRSIASVAVTVAVAATCTATSRVLPALIENPSDDRPSGAVADAATVTVASKAPSKHPVSSRPILKSAP